MSDEKQSHLSIKPWILVIYFGQRGGGLHLLREFLDELSEECSTEKVSIWTAKDISSEFSGTRDSIEMKQVEFQDFYIPHALSALLDPTKIIAFLKSIISMTLCFFSSRPRYVIQIMPSPLDLYVDVMSLVTKTRIVRAIHDSNHHLGEKWPTVSAIMRRVNRAYHVIVFSDFVKHELMKRNMGVNLQERISICSLPNQITSTGFHLDNYSEKEQGLYNILFIGRAIPYKGLEFIGPALSLLKFRFEFSACGLGKFPHQLTQEYKVVNKWLTDSEFMERLHWADIVIFPYSEASQSGIIPIACRLGKWIVFSDTGGLKEQVQNYEKAIAVKQKDSQALAAGITLAKKRIEVSKGKKRNETISVNAHPSLFKKSMELVRLERNAA